MVTGHTQFSYHVIAMVAPLIPMVGWMFQERLQYEISQFSWKVANERTTILKYFVTKNVTTSLVSGPGTYVVCC